MDVRSLIEYSHAKICNKRSAKDVDWLPCAESQSIVQNFLFSLTKSTVFQSFIFIFNFVGFGLDIMKEATNLQFYLTAMILILNNAYYFKLKYILFSRKRKTSEWIPVN